MKLKKLSVVSMAILAVAILMLSVTSCSFIHEHNFVEWETVTSPTCTASGLQRSVCVCGKTEYATVAMLDHTPVTDAEVAATCTAPGKTEGSHCEVCGIVITAQIETPKIDHSYSEWQTVAETSCTAFGLEKRTCECGYVEYNVENALGHTPVTDEAIEATCATPGKTEGSHCGECGIILVAQSTVASIGHNCDEVNVTLEALCNQDGVKRFSCTNEGCSYFYEESYSLPELSGSEIYNNAIQYTGILQTYSRFGNFADEASAFVIGADGIIVTSNFKIDNAFSGIFILGENEYEVTDVLAYNEVASIAVLKIDATDLPCAPLCTRAPISGETVYSFGVPAGAADSISRGVVSNAERVEYDVKYIQHDADMSSGYAGGPLINRYGEVIGMNIGYFGEEDLSLAVSVSEFDSLDYSNPITFEEYGYTTYTPAEQLDTWVVNNYNATGENSIAYIVEGSSFCYAFGYDIVDNYSYAEGFWVQDEIYQVCVRIIFDNSDGTYQYHATFNDGMNQNEAHGYIDAEGYNASTLITYDTFYGRYWNESELVALYSGAVYDTLEWFSSCLDTYFDTITLETFGFTSLEYPKDEEALDKLNSFIMTYGAQEPLFGEYALSGEVQMGEDLMRYNISYIPETAETVVSVHYSYANGDTFSVYLTLNTHENGNRFDFMYTIMDGEMPVILNVAWGYLDAATLTDTTILSCYVFDGMNEYEDGLLKDYASTLKLMMEFLNFEVMPSVDPALTVKDLGFLFYFG